MGDGCTKADAAASHWIPACAGMTIRCVALAKAGGQGMGNGGARRMPLQVTGFPRARE